MEMKRIHPCKDETYFVAKDDHCFVVSTRDNSAPESMKVWLSRSMIEWLWLHRGQIDSEIK